MPGLLQDVDVCFGWLSSIEQDIDNYKVADPLQKEEVEFKKI